MTHEQCCKLLWEGWKVIDDTRCYHYLFVSADGRNLRPIVRKSVDATIQEGYVKRVKYIGVPDHEQPGLALTDKGLELIGKPIPEGE